jgi:phage virion morphogenesis protein
MSGFVSITIDRSLADQLARATAEAADLRPAMDEISEEMLTDTRRRFFAEVAPGGVPWKKSQRAIEKGGKTLQDKGFLLRSLDRRSGANFAEVGVTPGGPQEAYAAIHQFGGTIVPKNKKTLSFGGRLAAKVTMPARPYLGFDPDTAEDIREILSAHLRRVFDQAAPA